MLTNKFYHICISLAFIIFQTSNIYGMYGHTRRFHAQSERVAKKRRVIPKEAPKALCPAFFQIAPHLAELLDNNACAQLMLANKQLHNIFKPYYPIFIAKALEAERIDPIDTVCQHAHGQEFVSMFHNCPQFSVAKLIETLQQRGNTLLCIPNYVRLIKEQFIAEAAQISKTSRQQNIDAAIDDYWYTHQDSVDVHPTARILLAEQTPRSFTYIKADKKSTRELITDLTREHSLHPTHNVVVNMNNFAQAIDDELIASLAHLPIYALYCIGNNFVNGTANLAHIATLRDLMLYECTTDKKLFDKQLCQLPNLLSLTIKPDEHDFLAISKIPSTIHDLSNLHSLDLNYYSFDQSIPPSLFSLTNLRVLGLPDQTYANQQLTLLKNLKTLRWTQPITDNLPKILLIGIKNLLTQTSDTACRIKQVNSVTLTCNDVTKQVAQIDNLKELILGPCKHPLEIKMRKISYEILSHLCNCKQFSRIILNGTVIPKNNLKEFIDFIKSCQWYKNRLTRLTNLSKTWCNFDHNQQDIIFLIKPLLHNSSLLKKIFSCAMANSMNLSISSIDQIVNTSQKEVLLVTLADALTNFLQQKILRRLPQVLGLRHNLEQLEQIFQEHSQCLFADHLIHAYTFLPPVNNLQETYMPQAASIILNYVHDRPDQLPTYVIRLTELLSSRSSLPWHYHKIRANNLIQDFLDAQLYQACLQLDVEYVKKILDHGAQANSIGNLVTQDTPLHVIFIHGQKTPATLSIACLLCEHGASLFCINYHFKTPCYYMADERYKVSFDLLAQIGGSTGIIHQILECRKKVLSNHELLTLVTQNNLDPEIIHNSLQEKIKTHQNILALFEADKIDFYDLELLAEPYILQLCMQLP